MGQALVRISEKSTGACAKGVATYLAQKQAVQVLEHNNALLRISHAQLLHFNHAETGEP